MPYNFVITLTYYTYFCYEIFLWQSSSLLQTHDYNKLQLEMFITEKYD